MKTIEDARGVAELEALLTKSTAAASGALAESVAWTPRSMNAAQLFEFWRGIRMVAMSTVGERGQPHSAPVHAVLCGATVQVSIYDNATRRRDLLTNPRVSFTAWNAEGAVAILYGRAREIEDSHRLARPSQSGKERHVVEFVVTLTRVHAMRAKSVCPPES